MAHMIACPSCGWLYHCKEWRGYRCRCDACRIRCCDRCAVTGLCADCYRSIHADDYLVDYYRDKRIDGEASP